MKNRFLSLLLVVALLGSTLISPLPLPVAQAASSPTPPTGWAMAVTFQKVPLTLNSVTYYAYELKKSTASAAGGWLITKADGTIVSDPATYQKLALTATVSKVVQSSTFLPQMKNELEVLKGIRWRIELYETTTLLTKLLTSTASMLAGNATAASGVLETAVTALVPAGAKITQQNKIHDALWSLFSGDVVNTLTPTLTKALEIVGKLTTSDSEKWLKISGVVSTVLRKVIAQFAQGGAATYQKAFTLANTPRSSWSYEDASLFLKEYEEGRTHGLPFAKWYISLIPHEGGLVGSLKNVGSMWWENIIQQVAGPEATGAMAAIDATVFARNVVQDLLKNTLFTNDITADIQSADAIFAVYRLTYDPSITGSLAEQICSSFALIPYRKGDKWGFCDQNKKLAIPARYDQAGSFHEGLAIVEINQKFGAIDGTGALVVPCRYDYVESFSGGLAAVHFLKSGSHVVGKWGFIDTKGMLVVPAVYDNVGAFEDGLAKVWEQDGYGGNLYGFIDTKGKMIVQLKYEDAGSFSEGLAYIKASGGKYGFIDTKGNVAIEATYDWPGSFSEGLAPVCVGAKWGFIDTKGTMVIPSVYDWAGSFSESLAGVVVGGKYGFIDTTGTLVVPALYDGAYPFRNGLAKVKVGGKWGFIDTAGTLVVPAVYDRLSGDRATLGNPPIGFFSFSDGRAAVEVNGKCGFIDSKGTLVISAIYSDLLVPFVDGLALVQINDDWPYKYGYIDTKGTQYWEN